MGTQNKRYQTTGNLKTIENKRRELQNKLDNSKAIKIRKQFGQFATPYELAKEIVSFGLSLQSNQKISFLEPALGTGSFYSALLAECEKDNKTIESAVGIELDTDFFSAANDLWGETIIDLVNANFTQTECFEKVNLLLSNPPYVRHHYIDKEQKKSLRNILKTEIGLALSGFAGLYCYFILLAHKWLKPNAISGWLIPSEFMDVNYGSKLKEYLLNNVKLLRIHMYNPEECKFNDALVSSCVVWFKNESIEESYNVKFSYGGTHTSPERELSIEREQLKKCKKWTQLFNRCIDELYSDKVNTSLGDFFSIKRGIATGDNNFFILSKEQIVELNLNMDFFIPILPSPRYLKCDEVFCDKNGYPRLDTQYFLLNCFLPEKEIQEKHPSIWHYLKSGQGTTSEKYLCRNRKVWYYQERRSVAPFLCSYMGRRNNKKRPFRFILNHSSAIATNSYLMLYPKGKLKEAILQRPAILSDIWNILCNINDDDLEREGRVYGGGLKKIEPKELSQVKCPDLVKLLEL